MSSIMDLLTEQLGSGVLGQLSKALGSDERTTGAAVSAALPAILGGLARNTQRPDGAEALDRALEKDHDGSIFGQLGNLLNSPEQGAGAGILRHVLGNSQPQVERGVSKSTGLDAGKVSQLMMTLAPLVMGALGKQKRTSQMNAQGLSQMLGQEKQQLQSAAPREMGMLDKLLDSDGDGDFDMGDMAKHGMGLLGKLMKG